jgi:RNA-directed DNA polymerase
MSGGRLRLAWKQVERNAGAAGIDEMAVGAFRERGVDLLREIRETVQSGIYRFQPVRFLAPHTNRVFELPFTC